MNDRDAGVESPSTDAHDHTAEVFVERALSRFRGEISELCVFGSTVRGETRGLASDVDVLVVLDSPDHDKLPNSSATSPTT